MTPERIAEIQSIADWESHPRGRRYGYDEFCENAEQIIAELLAEVEHRGRVIESLHNAVQELS